jgi:hypothetical protein
MQRRLVAKRVCINPTRTLEEGKVYDIYVYFSYRKKWRSHAQIIHQVFNGNRWITVDPKRFKTWY